MHTPRTHGRLYPGWRLPSLPVFGALQQRFNEHLAEKLRRNISQGLAQRKLPIYPWPNESNLLTLSDSLTTVGQPDLTAQNSEGKVISLGSSCKLSDNSPRHGRSLALVETPHIGALSHSPLEAVYLADGELLNDSVRPINRFRLYIAGCFEIYLELESPSTSENKNETLSYGIKRCSADSFKPSPRKSVIDVQQLNGEVLLQLSKDTVICLASNDVILEINIQGWTKDK
ncbi:hypothetical protein N7468_003550 [Penicillium chermesinum]|uniref:Uncharacterized protein n=1 Tax=Penicillium chermesinum TaxID=63820 RepID=A0A9W9P7D1_9EURO|nr:uncharacterized protein N7468_003550 [Penicillium chermesinum]KAJ5238931.1 hypothetical protein N7468_003550 [Penicillium chermesinum]